MKISTILDHIDSGHMALPEFQRGYVWNKKQVVGFFGSLYHKNPVGGLLTWVTDSSSADYRGDGQLAAGVVKLLLDGQQRMTSIYGVVRGKPPEFFDGNPASFAGLRFNLETEKFAFYQPVKMRDNSLWLDVSTLMLKGNAGMGEFITAFSSNPEYAANVGEYVGRMGRLLAILDIELHVEEITGADKTLDVVVDIFNLVNSGGTKLSRGDLALAKICADWPEARETMKSNIAGWTAKDYKFDLDWLLRSVSTVVTGEAKFQYLHDKSAEEIEIGLKQAKKYIDMCLNLIAGRLGLDHDRVLFGRYAIPVMVRYMQSKNGNLNEVDRDKLLFWYAQAGMWGRFSGSTESMIDKDMEALEGANGGLDNLLETLRLWHSGLKVESGHFTGWSLGARFYPVLYMLTRMGEAKDWGTGLDLKAGMLGVGSRLEVHHIFPKSQLYDRHFDKSQVNALGNFCFLTQNTNLKISNRLPEDYFPEIEQKHPGALASQWIPMDKELWKIENYPAFLEARKALLANETNRLMLDLLHGDDSWLTGANPAPEVSDFIGGATSEEEQVQLEEFNTWMTDKGLPSGMLAYEYCNEETGDQQAVFDMAWPDGIQAGLSQPTAIMLNESNELIAFASQLGYKCFTSIDKCKSYVEIAILGAG